MIGGPTDAVAAAVSDEFEFVNGGRTFACAREAPSAARPDGWWWFRVDGDIRGQRYAPFRASPDDTRENVQARVVAYYDDLLARRAQPATSNHWGRRPAAPGATAEPAAPSAEAAPSA